MQFLAQCLSHSRCLINISFCYYLVAKKIYGVDRNDYLYTLQRNIDLLCSSTALGNGDKLGSKAEEIPALGAFALMVFTPTKSRCLVSLFSASSPRAASLPSLPQPPPSRLPELISWPILWMLFHLPKMCVLQTCKPSKSELELTCPTRSHTSSPTVFPVGIPAPPPASPSSSSLSSSLLMEHLLCQALFQRLSFIKSLNLPKSLRNSCNCLQIRRLKPKWLHE